MNGLLPSFPRVNQVAWRSFSIVLALEVLLLGLLVLAKGYEGSFVLLHINGGPWLDALMPHLTHLADGALVAGLLGLFFAHKNPWLMVALILSLLMVALAVPLLKNGIFPDWNRPAARMAPGLVRELSLGKERLNSFPSGHSTAAACLGWFIAGLGKTWRWGLFTALMTLLLAYTRVYLGVHFPGDLAPDLFLGWTIAWAGSWLTAFIADRRQKAPASWVLRLIGGLVLVLAVVQTWLTYYQ